MQLGTKASYALLEQFSLYVKECCDQCGQIIAIVCYTRAGDSGVWCSRGCRDGKEAHAPGTCKGCGVSLQGMKRGAKWCSDTCRKRPGSQKVLDVPKNPGIVAHSKGVSNTGRAFGYSHPTKASKPVESDTTEGALL